MRTTYRDDSDDTIQATTILDVHYDAQPFTPAKLNGPPERCHEAEGGYCEVQGVRPRRIELRTAHGREPFAVLTFGHDGAVTLAAANDAAGQVADAYETHAKDELVDWCETIEGHKEEIMA